MVQDIIDRLLVQNPWWEKKKVPEALIGEPRGVDLERLLAYKEVKVITGVRRSGKSTLLLQLISRLLQKNTKPENILLLNFDFDPFKDVSLDEVMESYLEAVGTSARETHLFLDEVHMRDDWPRWVRRLYDLQEVKQIFITDSSSRLLQGEYARILTGRMMTKILMPLSFREFLSFKGFRYEPRHVSHETKAIIRRHLREYLQYGGFPEVFSKDEYGKQILLREYFSGIIHKDVAERFNVNPTKVGEIAEYLLTCFSSPVSLRSLRNNFGVGVGTASKYMSTLEEVFLFSFLRKYSPSLKTQIKDIKKTYCIDSGFLNIVGFKLTENFGRIAENTVYLELKRQQHQNPGRQVYYYRNHQQREVDFVVKEGLRVKQLIQVCWSIKDPKTKKREAESLHNAGKELKCKNLLIITEDYENIEKASNAKITYKPLWKWLLEDKRDL